MKRMRVSITLLLCLMIVLSLVACGQGSADSTKNPAATGNASASEPGNAENYPTADNPLVLKVSSFLAEADNLSAMFVHAAPKIEELSGGAIKFDVYYSGTLLGFSDMFSGVSEGISDIGLVGMAVMDSNTYLNQVFSTLHKGCPEDLKTLNEIYWQIMDEFPEIQAELADHNLVRIGVETFPGVDTLICAKKPITSVSDIKGLTLQCSQSMVGKLFTGLGASPVSMEVSEFYTALERGITDGVYDSWSSFSALKLMEVASDYTLFGNGGISSGIISVVMNLDSLNKLSPEQQDMVYEAIEYGINESLTKFYADQNEAIAYAKEHSTIHTVEGEDLDGFYEAMDAVIETWFADIEGKGYSNVREIYARIGELFAERMK